jgi:hypothetical protein
MDGVNVCFKLPCPQNGQGTEFETISKQSNLKQLIMEARPCCSTPVRQAHCCSQKQGPRCLPQRQEREPALCHHKLPFLSQAQRARVHTHSTLPHTNRGSYHQLPETLQPVRVWLRRRALNLTGLACCGRTVNSSLEPYKGNLECHTTNVPIAGAIEDFTVRRVRATRHDKQIAAVLPRAVAELRC